MNGEDVSKKNVINLRRNIGYVIGGQELPAYDNKRKY